MDTLNKIYLLLSETGKTQKDLTDFLGIEKSTFSQWKKGANQSYKKHISRIADYFGVTTDWLMGKSQFRTQQELAECYDSWEYLGNEYFNIETDFCGLLKPLREELGIGIEEMAKVIGVEPELYEQCEEGYDPITQQQAEQLCEYLGTDIEQVLFDNELLDAEIPYEEQGNVKGFLKKQQVAEDEAMREYYQNAPDDTDDETLALIARNARNLTPENRKKLLEMARLMFGEEFEDDDHTS